MREARSHTTRTEMCARFRRLIEDCLGWTWLQTAQELHYKTPATLYQVRAGNQFPDVERLALLAKCSTDGRRPNLDWILTGRGMPLISSNEKESAEALAQEILALPSVKQRAVRTLVKHLS